MPERITDLFGPTTYLRAPQCEDAEQIFTLLRERDVSRYFLWVPPWNLDGAIQYVTGCQYENRWRMAYHFAIIHRGTSSLLGVANLYDIDWKTREGEFGIWLGREYWGTGIQQEVSHLLLRYAFETVRLNRVLFRVAEENGRAQAAFRKLGMAERERVALFSQQHSRLMEHVVYVMEATGWELSVINQNDTKHTKTNRERPA